MAPHLVPVGVVVRRARNSKRPILAKTNSSDTVETDLLTAAEADTGAGAVGRVLRETREAKKLDLHSVADSLRIRRAHLEALEEGRHDRLPGATYAVGFIRTYADYLGLDGNEMARRFKAETAIEPENAELDFPTPVNEGGLPSAALLMVAVLLGAAVYGMWYWNTAADRSLTEIIDDVPERVRDMLAQTPPTPATTGEDGAEVPDAVAVEALSPAAAPTDEPVAETSAVEAPVTEAPAEAASSEPAPTTENTAAVPAPTAAAPAEAPQASAAAAPETAAPDTAEPETAEPVAALEEAPQDTVETRAVTPEERPQSPAPEEVAAPEAETAHAAAVADEPAVEDTAPAQAETAVEETTAAAPAMPVMPAVTGPGNVVVRATEDSWVQIRDGDKLLLSRLLRKGDTYKVPDGGGLVLMTGNAGGTRIEIDGTELPPLGGTGEVRRGIPLDAEKLLRRFANPT